MSSWSAKTSTNRGGRLAVTGFAETEREPILSRPLDIKLKTVILTNKLSVGLAKLKPTTDVSLQVSFNKTSSFSNRLFSGSYTTSTTRAAGNGTPTSLAFLVSHIL